MTDRGNARARVAAAAILAAQTALGRGGGGGHSGGGGGGGGGGGHSSGSGHADSVGYVGGYTGSGGASGNGGGFAVFVILGVIIVVWLLIRRNRGAEAAGAMAGAAVGGGFDTVADQRHTPGRLSMPPAIATIAARDPGFDLESFLQRAELTFFLVKRGLQKCDAAAIRPFVNDAVFGEVTRYIGTMRAQHQHSLLESLNIRALHLVEAGSGPEGQSIQVHFDLVYRAKTLDDANRVIADEGADGRHGERWTFVRAAGANTPAQGGVTASKCPACGAELRLALDGTCTHCRASVTNGSVDWVVAAVQPARFEGYRSDLQVLVAAPTFMEGIASLRAADAAFDLGSFRQRVKAAFLALQDAWCRQNLEAGRAFMSPGAYFSWAAQLETLAAEGRRNVLEDLQIQDVSLTRVAHGRVYDDLTVRITASCADYEVDAQGNIVFGDRIVRPFVEEWTFQRSVGVATTGKPGTLENTCPNCGAPVALTQIGECRYCKAAITSGKFDWVVSHIEQEHDAAAGGGDPGSPLGTQIAAQVGGAIVGGLLANLISGASSDDS